MLASLLTPLVPSFVSAQAGYDVCIDNRHGVDTPGINDPVFLKPLGVQHGYVNQTINIRLEWCDPENQAPGTVADYLPAGASLPDNGDGTRSFIWTPTAPINTEITFTVYEESDLSIRRSIVVPFHITPARQKTSVEDIEPDRLNTEQRPATQKIAISLSAQVPRRSSTHMPEHLVAGRLITLGEHTRPIELHYSAVDERGQVTVQGVLPVADDGTWEGRIPLRTGLNRITFSSTDITEQITVSYNPGYRMGGLLDVQPDVAYVDEKRLITARIALPDPQTEDAQIYLVDSETDQIVALMSDDGHLGNGDEIEGDSVFSALFQVSGTQERDLDYQVMVILANGQTAYSEPASLRVSRRFDIAELAEIQEQQRHYEAQLLTTDPDNRDAAVRAIAEALSRNPAVADHGINEQGNGLWVIYENGMAGAIYAPLPGVKGGTGMSQGTPTSTIIYPGTDLPPTTPEPAPDPSFPSSGSTDTGSLVQLHRLPLPYSRYCGANRPAGSTDLFDDLQNSALQGSAASGNTVRSSKVLAIAAQYWDWGEFDDVPQMQQILAADPCHDVTYRRYLSKGAGTVEDFKNLGDYGTILISSHGDSFYAGADSHWQQHFGWNGSSGQVVVDSNMLADAASIRLYEDDLQTGRLILWGSHFGITPAFVTRYSGTLPNSLVYMSICRGTWNASMATAFLNNGAGSFLGYDNYVSVAFCRETGPDLLNTLLHDSQSLQQAFTPGQLDPYSSERVEFDLLGAADLALPAGHLQDASFEQLDISQAWQSSGDARLVQTLGDYRPTDGGAMAVISTGLGYQTRSGTLWQQLCLCDGPTLLEFDWNFLSEEWLEYVGSEFQDSFTVSLLDTSTGTDTVLFEQTIDSLASAVTSVALGFDQNDVYATGWRHASMQLPDYLRGKAVSLQFEVSDSGDSIFDSAVLLDNITMQCVSSTASTVTTVLSAP